ncbi:hypothetical protein GK047_06925 [Paenibacillus sp. SYP-B3998]|uniref:Uncharacterized protein n=1 Tax=Paenibacillus sp. SYP-B3998 TaxID=2678564 RepID=A0A6G3ZW00_9BACL|nr:hypothetical protein [Paenibacillus sp. SYP-B3998]NEW05751.1 hypothetical protein [Paenibacillus sp. SYP-B3998]
MKKLTISFLLTLGFLFSFATSSFASFYHEWQPTPAHDSIYIEGNFSNLTNTSSDTLFIELYRVTPSGNIQVGSNYVNLGALQWTRTRLLLAMNQPAGNYKVIMHASGDWTTAAYLDSK